MRRYVNLAEDQMIDGHLNDNGGIFLPYGFIFEELPEVVANLRDHGLCIGGPLPEE